MTVSVFSAAERLVEMSGHELSHIQIQKLLYLSHMYHMGGNDRERLVYGHFEAWKYGPVHPDLFHKLKYHDNNPIGNVFEDYEHISDDCKEVQSIKMIYDALSGVAPMKLVSITHWEHGAWAKNYVDGIPNIIISDDDIIEEYEKRTKK